MPKPPICQHLKHQIERVGRVAPRPPGTAAPDISGGPHEWGRRLGPGSGYHHGHDPARGTGLFHGDQHITQPARVDEFVVAWDFPLMRLTPELNPDAFAQATGQKQSVFGYLQRRLHYRLHCIVDTAGKSLHGWFDAPRTKMLEPQGRVGSPGHGPENVYLLATGARAGSVARWTVAEVGMVEGIAAMERKEHKEI